MQQRSILAALGALLLGTVHAASAADLPVKAPPARAVVGAGYNWSGFYLGANCGVARARSTTENTGPDFSGFDNGVFTRYTLKDTAWTCGGQVGYNWQSGVFVFGLEAEGGYLDISRSTIFSREPAVTDADFVSVKYRWYATATGRVGIAWDRALLYAKGGAAWARITNAAADSSTGGVIDDDDFVSTTRTRLGWAAGGGLEYGLAPQWSVKFEYLYMDFGRFTSNLNADGDTFEHRNRVHTGKIGLNYRWGGGPVVARY
jgi:outer membrane immunogenic protein